MGRLGGEGCHIQSPESDICIHTVVQTEESPFWWGTETKPQCIFKNHQNKEDKSIKQMTHRRLPCKPETDLCGKS